VAYSNTIRYVLKNEALSAIAERMMAAQRSGSFWKVWRTTVRVPGYRRRNGMAGGPAGSLWQEGTREAHH